MAGLTEPPRREIREPRDAELAARDWMRWVGYSDAELTQGGADGGIDVQATGAVAQVKAEATPVGRPAIQQLHGVANVEEATALFFSWGGYSDGAVTWAERAGVALFTLNMIGEVEAVNDAASGIVAESDGGGERGEDLDWGTPEWKNWGWDEDEDDPYWDEDGPIVGRAAIWKWIEKARAEPTNEVQSLTVVHKDKDPPRDYTAAFHDYEAPHCWMRFVVEADDSRSVSFSSWGFTYSNLYVGYEHLGVEENGFPLGDPDKAFSAHGDDVSHHHSTRWCDNLSVLMKMVGVVAEDAGRPLSDGYWRFEPNW